MALGERFRSGGARGIALFLADHQHCDAGFDVRRDEAGSGRLRITCLGCGETVDYRAAEAGELAAGLPMKVAENGGEAGGREPAVPAPPEPPRAAAPPELRPRRPASSSRWSRIPGWVSAALIGALVVAGLTMVAIGVLRDDGEQAQDPTPTQTTPQPETTPQQAPPEGAGEQQQGAGGQGRAQPGEGTTQPQGAGGAAAGAEDVPLRQRRFADRFTIGVPPAWDHGAEGGAVVITAPGATAELNIFFEGGERPPGRLARAAADFLDQRHQRGKIRKSQPVRVGSRRGLRVRITYPGGEEVAVVVAAKGFSYLVLRRVDRGASPDISRQAEAALASFRPG
ncbi:MAG: hypothetical protein ACRDL6_00880 [Solirubrobacterales bacterium]